MKTRLGLVALGIVAVSSFSLILATSSWSIVSDPSNAVQHISEVFFLKDSLSNAESGVVLTNSGNYVKINTRRNGENKNIIIRGDEENTIDGSIGSHVLGGKYNIINGSSYGTIIGGFGNQIRNGNYSTIGGGKNNIILGDYNVIAGGSGNTITVGEYSSIPGGENNRIRGSYSVALGVNSEVNGDYSVALGSGSKVYADRSFLWTDGNQGDNKLEADDVFAVVSEKGMVINADRPHDSAKLTVSGSLVINSNDTDLVECREDVKGTIIQSGNCLCSCDGSNWNALYEGCDTCNIGKKEPECGSVVKKICNGSNSYYSGSCDKGKVVEGTGSYFVDRDNIVHRTCQSDDGNTLECTGTADTVGECPIGNYECDFSSIRRDGNVTGSFIPAGNDIFKASLFVSNDALGYNETPCAGYCFNSSYPNGRRNVKTDSLGVEYCSPALCEQTEFFGHIFPSTGSENSEDATLEVVSLNALSVDYNDGVRECKGLAECAYGFYTYLSSGYNCEYKCGRLLADNIYSGYYYGNRFNNGVTVTGTKTEANGQTCWRNLYCRAGTIEFVGEESCSGGYCYAYDDGKYNIPQKPVPSSGQAFRTIPVNGSTLTGSCTLPYACNEPGSLSVGTENCVCPDGYIYSGSVDKCLIAPPPPPSLCGTGDYPDYDEGVFKGEEGVGEWSHTDSSNPGTCQWTCKPGYDYMYSSTRGEYTCIQESVPPKCGEANGKNYVDLNSDNPLLLCNVGNIESFNWDSSEGKWTWKCSKSGFPSVECEAFYAGSCCENVPQNSYDVYSGQRPDGEYKKLCNYLIARGNGCFTRGNTPNPLCYNCASKACCDSYPVCTWDAGGKIVGFVCEEGYHLEGCECVESRCEGGDYPTYDIGVLKGEEGVGEWSHTDSSNPGECQWTCKTGYEYTYFSARDERTCVETSYNEPKCGFVNGEEYAEVSENNTDYGLCAVGDVEDFKEVKPYSSRQGWSWDCVEGSRRVSCGAIDCNYKSAYGQFCENGDGNGPGYEAGEWDLDTCTCRCPEGTFENEDHMCENPQCSYHSNDVQDCEVQGTIPGTWDVENCTCICPEGSHIAGEHDFHCEPNDGVGIEMCYGNEEWVSRALTEEEVYEMTHNYNYDYSSFLSDCRSDVMAKIMSNGIQPYGLSCLTDYRGTNHVNCECTYEYACSNPDDCNVEPRGFIPNGGYRVAWKRPQARVCVSEQRYCLNGRLLGSYLYSSCTNYRRR